MANFLQQLLTLLTNPTKADLLRYAAYLKAENRILRSKLPKRIEVTPAEQNRLVKLGSAIGVALKSLITIVSYRTFCRWKARKKPGRRPAKPGRRPTPEQIQELILRLARENGWGYTRILGELRKLRIHRVSRSTVVNILKAHGLDSGPQRGEGTWDEFIKTHLKTLWACDFLTQRVLTLGGFVDYYLLLFVHLETRRLFISPATLHPTDEWVKQQVRNLLIHADEQGLKVSHVIRDNDRKFSGGGFDAVLESAGAESVPIQPLSPNMNAYAERAIQTVQRECLDHFIVLGEKHLDYLVREFLEYYHENRPHQGKGNVPLKQQVEAPPSERPFRLRDVACKQRLGGLLKHYYRRAA